MIEREEKDKKKFLAQVTRSLQHMRPALKVKAFYLRNTPILTQEAHFVFNSMQPIAIFLKAFHLLLFLLLHVCTVGFKSCKPMIPLTSGLKTNKICVYGTTFQMILCNISIHKTNSVHTYFMVHKHVTYLTCLMQVK